MIVRCERCETRFKLDESRLPARGARVRCSRCKHAFFVTPPGAPKEELVHEVAAAAARAPEKTRAPEPSWDLEEGPDATVSRQRPGAAVRPPSGESDDEHSDWRFEDDVPGLDLGATRSASFDLSGSQSAPALVAPPDANEDSLAGLGDPESWDLLAGGAPGVATAAPAEPAPEPIEAPALAATTAPPAAAQPAPVEAQTQPTSVPQPRPRVAAAAARTAFAPPPILMPRRIPAAPRSAPVATWAGWAGLALLVAAIAWGSLRLAPASAAATASLAPVSGFEVSEARARIVDNLAAGPILVVSGRLRNPGPSERSLGAPLQVQLLDESGAPLAGRAAAAGPALPAARVREEAPERLASEQQAAAATLARAPVAPGAGLDFAAVFGAAPREASGFAVVAGGAAR